MIRSVAAAILGIFFISATQIPVHAAPGERGARGVIKDSYIVVLRNDVAQPAAVAADMGRAYGFSASRVYHRALKGFSASMTPQRAEQVKNDKRVLFVSQDREVSIDAKPEGRPGKPPKNPTPTPTPTPAPLSLTVTAPNGGEVMTEGETYRITWDSSGLDDNLWIGYKSCDSCLSWIATGVADTGYYDWTVDVGNTTNTQFKIYISGGISGVGTTSDTSDEYFTVNQVSPTPDPDPLSMRVVTPNGGETVNEGDVYRITWEAPEAIDSVYIGYKSCDSCLSWIATGVPNTGFYDWTVDVGNTTNTQFRISITGYDTGVGSASDVSDAPFTVVFPDPTPSPTMTPTPTPVPISQTVPTGIGRIGQSSYTGAGIGVAVIDTGVDSDHPDLDGSVVGGVNCVNPNLSYEDDNGHGTHVAGTIGARDNEIGVVGVAPEVTFTSVKVLSKTGRGSWSSVICGIDWVTAHAQEYNIQVANMSLGGLGSSDDACGDVNDDALHRAICNSTAAGVTYVVAAGNEGDDADWHVPAAYDDTVITVSALADSDGLAGGLGSSTSYGPDDTFASFSNFGPVVDLGAPGVNILSTLLGGGYGNKNGTSMATPHVAGAAALFHQLYPGATWIQVRDGLVGSSEPLGEGHTDPSGVHPEGVIRISGL